MGFDLVKQQSSFQEVDQAARLHRVILRNTVQRGLVKQGESGVIEPYSNTLPCSIRY